VWHPLAETIGEAYRKQYYPLGYTPALDGLRGLMTVGVMVTAYPKVERFLAEPCLAVHPRLHRHDFLLRAVPAAVLITLLVRTSGTALHNTEIVFLGKIFYGMYLWHFPILGLMRNLGAPSLVLVVLGLPPAVLLATLSYAFIERHFMRVRTAPAQPVVAVSNYASASS
jgi:peptidoglycan/LPS O-acetylase OafA/YrhL